MKKLFLSITAALFILFGGMSTAQADDYLRVGMEAAYAPLTGRKMIIVMALSRLKGLTNTLTVMTCKSPKKSLALLIKKS